MTNCKDLPPWKKQVEQATLGKEEGIRINDSAMFVSSSSLVHAKTANEMYLCQYIMLDIYCSKNNVLFIKHCRKGQLFPFQYFIVKQQQS